MMIPQAEVEVLIRDLFEEQALALGGLVAIHDIENDLVWRLVRNMDVIREKIFRRLENSQYADEDIPRGEAQLEPHPAIEEFLARLRGT